MLPMLPMLPMLIMLSTLIADVALAGESIVCVDLNLSAPGMYSLMGDNESGLYATEERTCEGMQSIRRFVSSRSATGEGGVGVRGGAGIGRLEAIEESIGRGVSLEDAQRRDRGRGVSIGEIELELDLEGVDSRGYQRINATGTRKGPRLLAPAAGNLIPKTDHHENSSRTANIKHAILTCNLRFEGKYKPRRYS
jgi:hypothetical protein